MMSRVMRFGTAGLLAIALLCLWQQRWLAAAAATTGAGMLWCGHAARTMSRRQLFRYAARVLNLGFLAALAPAMLTSTPGLAHWTYVLPLITFALWPLPWAGLITATYLTMVVLAGVNGDPGLARHQFIACSLLAVLLSGLLLFMREYKARQLAPLRRTDELTQAASREYLSADLHKEIQRSEREGIEMAILMIGLDTRVESPYPKADIIAVLPRIGRYLNAELRDFDSYYRVSDFRFLAILPGHSTATATAQAETLRAGLCQMLETHGVDMTVSAGVAGLNIGDDADSLQRAAARALHRAQQQEGNRTQSFSAWSGAPSDPQGKNAQ
jgi:diguanylate cyclase (GGDEF)-like protein